MINIDKVVDILQTEGPLSFNQIWDKVGSQIQEKFEMMSKNDMKANLHLSMIQDFRLIMTGKDNWDVKEKYTTEQLKNLNDSYYDSFSDFDDTNIEDTEDSEEIKTLTIDMDIEEDSDFEDEDEIADDIKLEKE